MSSRVQLPKPALTSECPRSSRNLQLQLAALVVLLAVGVGLRLANLGNVSSRTPDERVYTYQANVLLHPGTAGLRALVTEYQRDPVVRQYPTPTRAGYLWLLTTVMRITGSTDVSVGAGISCVASIGSLLVLFLIGVRFFPPWAMLFAGLFFAISPAELWLARRSLQDALLEFLGLALILVAGEINRNSRRYVWY